MQSNEFEDAFANFIDRREYDKAENALFAVVRSSFMAGWLAAGGQALPMQPVIMLVRQAGAAPPPEKTE